MPTNNLSSIQHRITQYETKYQREPGSVQLLVASKNQTIEKITALYQAGQKKFGESYLQEALPKIASLPDIEWHFIGPIQANKTRKIAEHFSWVHSISSEKIAKRLNDQRPDHFPPLNICIEVNISEETTKSGILAADVLSLAELCSNLPRLTLRGLMAIPMHKQTFAEQQQEFHKLRLLFDALKEKGLSLDTLSMGMSNDMEAAIAEGSTLIRIGTAFFGQREKNSLTP